MQQPFKKITIIGPESTGKSYLSAYLAGQYRSHWVPEYAREYLLENGRSYGPGDLLRIARGQQELENKAVSLHEQAFGAAPLFCDTDLWVIKVWSEFVFGSCDPWILEQIAATRCDLYLLCNTDLPWVQDELREYPDLQTREILFHIYKDLLVNQPVPWVEIAGTPDQRLQSACLAVDHCLGV